MEPIEQCPGDPEEQAEQRLLGHMSPEQAAIFDAHVSGCTCCTAVLAQSRAYIEAMRDAGREFRGDESS